ncbi:hypothetical protein AWB91_09660 [Mycobacterium paraense]|uniref:Carboxymuconolactone decarboxylase-like domain-containing protein n=1 Tax=Mycobacterium paraense TaxID=767916 RepID=A0ABX3VRZ3_9MYCO|nr:carboxymuconolactone decarboxylase family protein [Mycobacterium paraense]ORW32747.1 hypothetical protein AWB91_09660 [Mycobacterium paraense]ORW44973.1 hypothetical protein AWB88_04735 [Mycobacterium paraense]
MSDRLPRIPFDELDACQRELYDRITGGLRATSTPHFPLTAHDGTLNGPFGVMVHGPVLGSILEQLGTAIRYHTALSPRQREIAILHVAQAERSEFEWWAHTRVGRNVGLTAAELDELSRGDFVGQDDVERASAAFCRILLGEGNLTDHEFANFAAALCPSTMIELTVLVGYYRMLAQLMSVFDIGLPPDALIDNG